MRLPKFDYKQPQSIQEVSPILLDQPDARVLAGGTDLLVNLKHGVEKPSVVVSLKGLSDLDYVRKTNGALRIGALTPLKKVYNDPYVAQKLGALAEAGLLRGVVSSSDHGDYRRKSLPADPMQVLQSVQMVAKRQADLFQSRRRPVPCRQERARVLLDVLR